MSTTYVGIINFVGTSILAKQGFVRHLPHYCLPQLTPPQNITEVCIKWIKVMLIDRRV